MVIVILSVVFLLYMFCHFLYFFCGFMYFIMFMSMYIHSKHIIMFNIVMVMLNICIGSIVFTCLPSFFSGIYVVLIVLLIRIFVQ